MAKPNPSWPIRTPGWRITRLPIKAWEIVTFGPIEQSRPIRTPGPMTACAPMTRAGADLGARADHGAGIDRDAVLQPRRRMDEGAGRDARRRANEDPGARADGKSSASTCGEDPIGLRRHERDGAGRHLGGEARRHEAGARPGRRERLRVGRVVHVGEIGRAGGLERRDAAKRSAPPSAPSGSVACASSATWRKVSAWRLREEDRVLPSNEDRSAAGAAPAASEAGAAREAEGLGPVAADPHAVDGQTPSSFVRAKA